MVGKGIPRFSHVQPSTKMEQACGSSRLIKNNQKWDSIKEEIRRLYMVENKTLPVTINIIKESRNFTASERKWKSKLKEWGFDKHIPARDMRILVAKAEKRARDEGKGTVFLHGGSVIGPERLGHFKRRKAAQVIEAASPSAETPANVTYHTPREDPDDLSLRASTPEISILSPSAAIWDVPYNIAWEISQAESASTPTQNANLIMSSSCAILEDSLDIAGGRAIPQGFASMALTHPMPISQDPRGSGNTKMIDITTHIPKRTPLAVELTASLSIEETSAGILSSRHGDETPLTSSISHKVYFLGSHPDFRFLVHDTVDNPEFRKINFDFSPLSVEQIQEVPSLNIEGLPANERHLASMSTIISSMPHGSTLSDVFATLVRSTEISMIYIACKIKSSYSVFYYVLEKLIKAYTYHSRWAEATIVAHLQLMGYGTDASLSSESQTLRLWCHQILRCVLNLAHLFEKTGDLDMAESHYRGALVGFERMGYGELSTGVESDIFHESHLVLSEFFLELDRDGEALHLLLTLLVQEASTRAKKPRPRNDLFGLLEKVFLKIDPSGGLKTALSPILAVTSFEWNWTQTWSVFTNLAGRLSVLGHFVNAELLFQFTISKLGAPDTGVRWRFMNKPVSVLQLYKDHAEHYQRQNKWIESAAQLKRGFDCAGKIASGFEFIQDFQLVSQELGQLLDKAGVYLLMQTNETIVKNALRDAHSSRLAFRREIDFHEKRRLDLQEQRRVLNI